MQTGRTLAAKAACSHDDLSAMSLSDRLFAWMMHRESAFYEPLVADRKAALLGGLRGTVVEIGPGTGVNLRYLGPGVTRWVGVEPNRHMHPYLHRAAARQGRPVEVHAARAEHLPLPDGAADAVVSTLVLCSVADVAAVLAEVRRVLRPGGRFVFVEHVAAPRGSALSTVQRAVQPLWRCLAGGCHPHRHTAEAIAAAGFSRVEVEAFRLPLPVVAPHVAGWALR